MRDEALAARDAAAWRLVQRQHGGISRRQLLRLGFGEKAIEHRLAIGRLHPVHRGAYAVGRPHLTREGRWMAAVLACGPDAFLSHGSAAALWGIGKEGEVIEVIVLRRGWPRRRGIEVRSHPSLPSIDLTSHRRIPLTSPARTALDQATQLSDADLERLINEADARDRIDPESLRRCADLRPGEPGVKRIRLLLDRDSFCLSDSELERRFRPIALAAGLPLPETKVFVNGFEVDFHFPTLGLVVETDSLRCRRTAAKQSRDLLRDQTHTAAGLTPLRFNHWQIAREPAHVQNILSATLRLRLHPSEPLAQGHVPGSKPACGR